ncbi:DUF2306 domain-containing protein [Micromonospora chersina]|uniref:DUF2306 domain-containing protein n=1 Tax=Micromonospora chersina TaxID=47854 RepID=UPI0033E36F34
MELSTENPVDVRTPPEGGSTGRRRDSDRRPRRSWGVGLLTFIVIAWLMIFVVPVYLTFDPHLARIQLRAGSAIHYPLLIIHVWTGTIAMLTGCLQLWPRLRRRRPAVHRISGRIYAGAVLLGAPALAALIVIRGGDLGTVSTAVPVGFGVLTVLWVWTTWRGVRYARLRRFADHRRMMIYSFAFTLSIIWSRVAFIVAMMIPGSDMRWVGENTGWFPWVFNLLVAHWWINRTARRPLQLPDRFA